MDNADLRRVKMPRPTKIVKFRWYDIARITTTPRREQSPRPTKKQNYLGEKTFGKRNKSGRRRLIRHLLQYHPPHLWRIEPRYKHNLAKRQIYALTHKEGRANIQNTLLNASPMEDVLGPAILNPWDNTKHILHCHCDTRPVVGFYFWHRDHKIGL